MKRAQRCNTPMLDVFYTKRCVIETCVEILKKECASRDIKIRRVLDFSAGDGAFGEVVGCKRTLSYDLQPRSKRVKRKDWFHVRPKKKKNPTVIGFNPPFGYQSVLLKKFLVHAAEFKPKIMAVVHPFVKKRIAPEGYGIVKSVPLRPDDFYDPETQKACRVPNCMFSIMVRGHVEDRVVRPPPDFGEFTCIPQNAPWFEGFGFAVRNKGVYAGQQIILFGYGQPLMINQREELLEIDVSTLATASFHKFVSEERPSAEFVFAMRRMCAATVRLTQHGVTRFFSRENAEDAFNQTLVEHPKKLVRF